MSGTRCTCEGRGAYGVVVRKSEGKRLLRKHNVDGKINAF